MKGGLSYKEKCLHPNGFPVVWTIEYPRKKGPTMAQNESWWIGLCGLHLDASPHGTTWRSTHRMCSLIEDRVT